MLNALKAMNGSLANIVTEVRSSADTMARAVDEIAQGNMDLSGRTEEQASSLEATSNNPFLRCEVVRKRPITNSLVLSAGPASL
jgi:hypothetical protein